MLLEYVGFVFHQIWKLFSNYFFEYIFSPCFFSPFGTPMIWLLDLLLLSHRCLYCSIFKITYFFLCILLILLLSPSSGIFNCSYCIFMFYNFHLVLFISFIFLWEAFVIPLLNEKWSRSMMTILKSLSGNSNTNSSQCWFLWIVLSHSSCDFLDPWYDLWC